MTAPLPDFSSPPRAGTTRRLLLVSPAFPPSAEVGALRWRRMAEVLATRNWALDVIAGAAYPWERSDPGPLQALPPGVRVWTPALRPAWPDRAWRALKPLLVRSRGHGAVGQPPQAAPSHAVRSVRATPAGATPDAPAGPVRSWMGARMRGYRARNHFASWTDWCARVEHLGSRIAAADRPTVVASSGPPHMAHEAARRLAVRLGVPLVLDLRDPWFAAHAEPADLRGPVWQSRTARYEAAACSAAAHIVVNTSDAQRFMRERYPSLADRIHVVMNGADPDVRQFAGRAACFEILHAGSLYGGRDPRALLQGVRRFLDAEQPAPGDVRVTFIGDTRYEGEALTDLARAAGVHEVFTGIESLPREDALRHMGQAAVLAVLPQQWSASVPAKVFEYMQFDAWLLVMGREGDAMTTLMQEAGADVVPPHDDTAIAQVLARRYREWKGGTRATSLNADGRFDRAVQATRLAGLLESLG